MATLQVIPPDDDTFPQQCLLGPKLFRSIKARLGQYAEIQTSHCNYLCKLFKRPDKVEGYIQFNNTVHQLKQDTTGYTKVASTISSDNIKLLAKKDVDWAHLTVVFREPKDVTKYRRSKNERRQLEQCIQEHFEALCVKKNFCLVCENIDLSLYGISNVIVNRLPSNIEYGCFTASTNIEITEVMSFNKFQQMYFRKERLRPIRGFEKLTAVLKEFVEVPFKNQELVASERLVPRGCLISGSPGSGKTTLVEHVAKITGAYVEHVNGDAIISASLGEMESNLRLCFERAKEMSDEGASIVLIENVDVLAAKPTITSSSASDRITSQLLNLIDDMYSENGGTHVVIAVTNRPAVIDPRLTQGARFQKEIVVGVPTYSQRLSILSALTSHLPLASSISLTKLAEATPGYLPADLVSIVQFASHKICSDNLKELSAEAFTAALLAIKPSTQRGSDIFVAHHKPISWNDIGGLEDVKSKLKQAIEWPLKHAGAFCRLCAPRPKGVLLTGPPGCAKTTLVRAAASQCHVTFLAVSCAQVYSKWVGEAEKKIREVFRQARAGAPCILFFDEIDGLVGRRRGGKETGGGVNESVMSTLLNEMDGVGNKAVESTGSRGGDGNGTRMVVAGEGDIFTSEQVPSSERGGVEEEDNGGVLVVFATNRADILDSALIRPGRIDRIIHVPLPDEQTRKKILEVYTRKMPLDGVSLDEIAKQTDRFCGADLENLCREAGLCALTKDMTAKVVTQEDMNAALNTALKQKIVK